MTPPPLLAQEGAVPKAVLNAVGRLNAAGYKTRRMCSATLIAPDTVLSAAHCVPPQPSLREGLRFVAGWDRGDFIAARGISDITLHPDFQQPDVENIPYDIALLTLDAPITEVAPLPLSQVTAPTVRITGYSFDRPHLIAEVGPCNTRDLLAGSVLRADCPTQRGFSGAPVLTLIDSAWHVTAVAAASNNAFTYAVPIAPWAAGAR